MKDRFLESLEGKGRPTKRIVYRPRKRKVGGVYVPVGYKLFTEDTDDTFACFGPPTLKIASRYINFMMLMVDSGRALTMYDLDQLCTGSRNFEPGTSRLYSPGLCTLCKYKYIRKLQYGRKINGRGRPYALYVILPKGVESVRRFRKRCIVSKYYKDTLARLIAEKKRIYDRMTQVPKEPTVKPSGRAF